MEGAAATMSAANQLDFAKKPGKDCSPTTRELGEALMEMQQRHKDNEKLLAELRQQEADCVADVKELEACLEDHRIELRGGGGNRAKVFRQETVDLDDFSLDLDEGSSAHSPAPLHSRSSRWRRSPSASPGQLDDPQRTRASPSLSSPSGGKVDALKRENAALEEALEELEARRQELEDASQMSLESIEISARMEELQAQVLALTAEFEEATAKALKADEARRRQQSAAEEEIAATRRHNERLCSALQQEIEARRAQNQLLRETLRSEQIKSQRKRAPICAQIEHLRLELLDFCGPGTGNKWPDRLKDMFDGQIVDDDTIGTDVPTSPRDSASRADDEKETMSLMSQGSEVFNCLSELSELDSCSQSTARTPKRTDRRRRCQQNAGAVYRPLGEVVGNTPQPPATTELEVPLRPEQSPHKPAASQCQAREPLLADVGSSWGDALGAFVDDAVLTLLGDGSNTASEAAQP